MNVLFVAIDDLRDWTGYLHTHPQVKTPNLDRFAAECVAFDRAYCPSPCCNPSRTAIMSGLRASTTGVYGNSTDWRQIVPKEIVHLHTQFQKNGYYVAGSGKIYHEAYTVPETWDDYLKPVRIPAPKRAAQGSNADADLGRYWDGVGGIKFMPLDCKDEDMEDYQIVSYAIDQLNRKHDKPFFLACGLRKPHMPWNVPQKYYDMYPLDSIVLPTVIPNDLDDIPAAGIDFAKPKGDHAAILKSGQWKNAVQAYLATITFCDAMLGRLFDAFEKSAYRDNTIVVVWSDHGWHLGEKEHWRKFALWEEATRAPLLWKVPGLTKPGTRITTPVDLMHIYPTLCDLTGVPLPQHKLEGTSIRSLLANPTATPADGTFALMTWLQNNHAIRTTDWRYIRYADGSEELYDEKSDPHEWTNLANKPELQPVKERLANLMPKTNVPPGKSTNNKGKDEDE